MKLISHSVRDTLNIGHRIARLVSKGDIICLFGGLGSGKTVLARGIAEGLGIDSADIISPTFVLLRELKGKLPIYHFDLYRMENISDIARLGYEEYLYGEGLSVIEWADRLGKLLPKEFLKINLLTTAEKTRRIELLSFGRRYEELVEAIITSSSSEAPLLSSRLCSKNKSGAESRSKRFEAR